MTFDTIRRRQLRLNRVGLALVLGWALVCSGGPARAQIDHARPHGEPYKLLGKRLVFTSWYFVYPGEMDWQDSGGKSVFTARDPRMGPLDAHFQLRDAPSGIRLVAEPAQRVGPLIRRERAWEEQGIGIQTIIRDGEKYRAWGVARDGEGRARNCYLESRDGMKWERPNLGLVDFNGSRDNNLFEFAPGEIWIAGIFIDPSAPPEVRYKCASNFEPGLVTDRTLRAEERPRHLRGKGSNETPGYPTGYPTGVQKQGTAAAENPIQLYSDYMQRRPWSKAELTGEVIAIVGATSPDGLKWKKLSQPLSVEMTDGGGSVYYDQSLNKYVMFSRYHMLGMRAEGFHVPTGRRHSFISRRSISRSESPIFGEFPLTEMIIEPDNEMVPTDSFYYSCYTTIPDAPDHHLMFPTVFHQSNDTTSIHLFSSYSSKVWHRIPGSPVLRTAEFGQWDGGCIFAWPNLVELPDGSWALPYHAFNYPHKYPRPLETWKSEVGLAVWPKGRLMAVEAAEQGEFTTVAFLSPGARIRINALSERAGSILVEAADLAGKPLPGRSFAEAIPIVGDQHRTLVQWKGGDDLGITAGQPLRLRFRMNQAKLYGLDFE